MNDEWRKGITHTTVIMLPPGKSASYNLATRQVHIIDHRQDRIWTEQCKDIILRHPMPGGYDPYNERTDDVSSAEGQWQVCCAKAESGEMTRMDWGVYKWYVHFVSWTNGPRLIPNWKRLAKIVDGKRICR